MSNKAKRKIHKFDFQSEGAHIALVDKAANLQTVLTMKAAEKEVTISLSMKDFLQKFFDLWSDDAELLAKMLGYSGNPTVQWEEGDTWEDYINNKVANVQLLKGVDTPDKLPESLYLEVEELQKKLEEKLTSEGSPLEDNVKIEKGESQVDETTIEVQELETLKAAATEVETLKAQLEEMNTLKSLVADLKKEKEEKAKSDMVELVKGYNFIPEEDQEGVVAFLLKSEDSGIMISTLEKARDAIASVVEVEKGVEAEETEVDLKDAVTVKQAGNDLVSKILSDRNK